MSSRTGRIALTLALTLSMPLAMGCSSGAATVEETDEAAEQVNEEAAPSDNKSSKEEASKDASPKDEGTSDATTTQETQRIGAEGIGFVEVPANWMEFKDVDGNSSIQWCDGTPYTIISLNTFDTSGVPEDQRASFSAEDAANSIWDNMLNDGVSEDAIQGARVTLANREALQVYGLYPDGSFLVCWLVEDDNGVIRYVSAEGPESTIYDAVEMVQNTYEL
ncbi:MAG: hypothetical protein J6D34_07930 [Atopobiaceae bacterium]|nr:hypothetical protein [Atopobiaceae bacterium]